MRSRISTLTLAGLLLLTGVAPLARAASPADLWPLHPPTSADDAALAAAAATLPPELAPATRFEQTFRRILAGAPVAEWLPAVRGFTGASGSDPVTAGVREVALAWVARAEMADWQTALENYYAQNVRFPATLAEAERDVPRELRVDPWGQPWAYRLRAPQGFAKQTDQRYELGPARYPDLGSLREAVAGQRPFTPPAWKVVPRVAGGSPALEFQSGGAVVGLIQPGGRIDGCPLLYIGDHWALMAGRDQLFTVAF